MFAIFLSIYELFYVLKEYMQILEKKTCYYDVIAHASLCMHVCILTQSGISSFLTHKQLESADVKFDRYKLTIMRPHIYWYFNTLKIDE